MTLCDAGDVFTIPGDLGEELDQITRGVAACRKSPALPVMLGGDHSIGFPACAGSRTSKRIGIIHFDRHIDIQEKDLDERMHTRRRGVMPGDEPAGTCRRPIWCNWGSADGRCRARAW